MTDQKIGISEVKMPKRVYRRFLALIGLLAVISLAFGSFALVCSELLPWVF